MNYKKIAITAAAAGVMLSAAMPALASVNIGIGNGDIEQSNRAFLFNRVRTSANSGNNTISGPAFFSDITTGNATAVSSVTNFVNWNEVSCGCTNDVNIGVGNGDIEQSNGAIVINSVRTRANTGGNSISGPLVVGSDVDTGNAGATGVVANVVNSNVVQ